MRTKKIQLIATMIIAAICIAEAQTTGAGKVEKNYNIRIYGLAENFEWTEYFQGQELLEESGPIFGLGGDLEFKIAGGVWIEGGGEIFAGDVDYDGHIMTSDNKLIPYDSTTSYEGIKIEGDLAYQHTLPHSSYIKPYAGAGIRAWRRTLDTELSDRYIGRYGYEEDWATLYGILGIKVAMSLSADRFLFAAIEGHFPFENEMSVDLSNQNGPSDIDLDPGKENTWYAEAGFDASPFTVSVFYETLEFSQSPPADDHPRIFQPRSEAEVVGLKLGFFF